MTARAVLAVLIVAAGAPGADVATIIRGVENRYNRVSTLRVSFEQRHLVAGRPRRLESGTLVLRKPGRMRWEYSQPAGKLFVSDGKRVWLYSPGAQQVERARLKQADDFRAPLAFLLGRLDLRRAFGTFELEDSSGLIRLSAWPKSSRAPFTRVDFFLTAEFRIRRLIIHQVDETAMEFTFSNEQFNVPVQEAAFRFQPPPGIPVVDTDSR